ncbi:hypothetical protein EDC01DRAFT_715277 [Geopyxis carbonaria]|nr:hypothetical protein EDC01DRAFT_715277 [Geopyxis carbonaria]
MAIVARTNQQWALELHRKIPEVLGWPIVYPPSLPITEPNDVFASLIDHTQLKPDASPDQIDKLCDEAIKHKFKSCCVHGINVAQVAKRLEGSEVLTCCVVGFPLGSCKSSVKAFETKEAIEDGAQEIDMVMNISALKAKDYSTVWEDIRAVIEAADGVPVKVILETVFLTSEEKVAAAYISAEAGAAFVKTCTGFNGGGASVDDVSLMQKSVRHRYGVKVKASAGLRTFEKVMEMVQAGAQRIGTSSGASIMEKNTTAPYLSY